MTPSPDRTPAGHAGQAEELPEHLQILENAIVAIETDEGFQNWLRFRSSFHNYSLWNQLMIALQCPHATYVAGYQDWKKKHKRQVMKGEKSIVILAPIMRKFDVTDLATGEEKTVRRPIGFRGARVFDVSQTEGEPLPQRPPAAELSGNSHAHLLPQLIAHAEDLGYTVKFEEIPGGTQGYHDRKHKTIAVDPTNAVNAQVRILIHELVHAHGTSYEDFGRELSETITDSATYVACRSLGLDVLGVVAQYVAGWSDREIRERALAYIDFYAAAIERACGLHDRSPKAPPPPNTNDATEALAHAQAA